MLQKINAFSKKVPILTSLYGFYDGFYPRTKPTLEVIDTGCSSLQEYRPTESP